MVGGLRIRSMSDVRYRIDVERMPRSEHIDCGGYFSGRRFGRMTESSLWSSGVRAATP